MAYSKYRAIVLWSFNFQLLTGPIVIQLVIHTGVQLSLLNVPSVAARQSGGGSN